MLADGGYLLPVRYIGARSGSGSLTHGQRNTLAWVLRETDPSSAVLQWIFSIPPGAGLDDVAASARALIERHESLRTSFPDGPDPVQVVLGSGTFQLEVYPLAEQPPDIGPSGGRSPEAGPPADGEGSAVAEQLIAALRVRGIDFRAGPPLRVACAVRDSVPVAAVAIYSHLAVDFASMVLLGQQFTELAGPPAARATAPPEHQPLDQAEIEVSRHGRRQAETALKYWESRLWAAPQSIFAMPSPAQPGTGHRTGVLTSARAGVAVRRLAAPTGVGAPAVLLAALCAVLATRTGLPRCSFVSVSGNRFRLRLRDYIGTLAQDGLVEIALDCANFDELVARTGRATLAANSHSLFDSAALWPVIDSVCAERGTAFTRDFTVNDLSAHFITGAEPDGAAQLDQPDGAEPNLEWSPAPEFPLLLMCNPIRLAPDLQVALTGDLRWVEPAEIELLLRGLDRLLVAAAGEVLPLDRLGEVAGVRPVRRGPDWALIDSCWVLLPEVGALLRQVTGRPAAGFVSTGPGEAALTGYLAASSASDAAAGWVARLHTECLAVLANPGWHRAMAPSRYVVCEGEPDDPYDEAAWLSRPVLAEGSGRVSRS